jgi:hypothetical protein
MLLFWRKNKEIDSFANILADELYSQLPPQMLAKQEKTADRKLVLRFDKQLQNIVTRLQDFKAIHNLGVYGKARFHLTFMERLRSHGYPEALTKEINEYLLINVP